MTQGFLNDEAIETLSTQGGITHKNPLGKRLQPASLDLQLGKDAFLFAHPPPLLEQQSLRKIVQRYHGEHHTLHDQETHDQGKDMLLKPGMTAIIKLQETLALPETITAKSNPKSSIGRLDVFVRVFGDGLGVFDDFPAGYKGALYAYIKTSSFPICLSMGQCLAQMRFCYLQKQDRIRQDVLPVHIALMGEEHPSIFRSLKTNKIMTLDSQASHRWEDFFQALPSQKTLHLDAGKFYLLCSREIIEIPPNKVGEIQPYDTRIGELRTHYAGFLDPGFSGKLILEVRAHEPLIITDGQRIGHIIMEPICTQPKRLYGDQNLQSSYQNTNHHLAKYFYSSRA